MEIGSSENVAMWKGESWQRETEASGVFKMQRYSCHVVSGALSSHPPAQIQESSQDLEGEAGRTINLDTTPY